MAQRFQDQNESLYDYLDHILVRCPRCSNRASVVRLEPKPKYLSGPSPARLACVACGYIKDAKPKSILVGAPVDSFFQLPLWLQIPCCGETLWAYNEEHLDFLERYVRAELRKRGLVIPLPKSLFNVRKMTMAAKLPQWIKSAKNRDEILRCIEKLRKTLE